MESQQLMACAILTIVIIGCFGNILSFTLFSRPHMRVSSVNVLLCALSFVDFSLLFLAVPTFVVPGLDIWGEDHRSAVTFLAYVLKFVYPVNLIMQTCSIYIMVTITMERWTAVCKPLQVRIWCTPRKSRVAILVIFLSSVAYNFVRFFEYNIEASPEGGLIYSRLLRDPQKHHWYVVGYFTALYLLTHFLIPFSTMAVMNGHVILTMWRLRSARRMLTRQQQREQSTTIMLLIVTGMFAFCNTLPFLLNLIECAYPDLFVDERTANIAFQVNDLSNLLVVLNSATTFLIYMVFSEKYRQTLCFLFKNGCCATKTEFDTYTTMSRTASMRVNSGTQNQMSQKLSTTSRSSELLLKPIYAQPRNERSVSEYNVRTKKKKQSLDETCRFPSARKAKVHKLSAIESRHFNTPEITITFTDEDSTVTGRDECTTPQEV